MTGNASDQTRNQEVWALAYERIREGLISGQTVILDATHATLKTRKQSISVAEDCNAHEIIGIYFPVDIDVAKARNEKRKRKVPEHVIDRMAKQLEDEFPSSRDGFTFFEIFAPAA